MASLRRDARIRRELALGAESPARRDRLAPVRRYRELAERHRAGGHVEDERVLAARRRRERDRIRPEHGLAPVGGHDERPGVGQAEPDHVVRQGHHGVAGRRAVVVRVAAGHEAHAVGARLGDGELHGERGRVVPESLLAVHHRGGPLVADDLGLRRRYDPAAAIPALVRREHADPVRIDAAQVCPDHEVGREVGDGGRRGPPVEHRDEERLEGRGGDDEGPVGHRFWAPCSEVGRVRPARQSARAADRRGLRTAGPARAPPAPRRGRRRRRARSRCAGTGRGRRASADGGPPDGRRAVRSADRSPPPRSTSSVAFAKVEVGPRRIADVALTALAQRDSSAGGVGPADSGPAADRGSRARPDPGGAGASGTSPTSRRARRRRTPRAPRP